jgi:hypothetical protein
MAMDDPTTMHLEYAMWHPHTEHPTASEHGTSALIALESETADQDLYLSADLCYWDAEHIIWRSETSDTPIPHNQYWWCYERDALRSLAVQIGVSEQPCTATPSILSLM